MTSQVPPHPAATAPRRATSPAIEADDRFLATLGRRVRDQREHQHLSRRQLAQDAGVSERYLAQLETGIGNISVLLLRRVAAALGRELAELFLDAGPEPVEQRLARRLLAEVPAHRREDLVDRLLRDLGRDQAERHRRIALIGMRGAGKSTLGRRLAAELSVRFVEMNEQVEGDTGLPLAEIFALYGPNGYRRLEHRCLERLLKESSRAVISVGGGIVGDEAAYRLLLDNCRTVWLKTTPTEHMARVLAQGDLRPMAGNDEAMQELQDMLAARESMYRKADLTLDTSGQTPEQSLSRLRQLLNV